MKHRVYLQRSRKFITTSKRLNSFEVNSSRHAAVKSSRIGCAQVDRRRLGVILASSRVRFLYLRFSCGIQYQYCLMSF